MIEKWMADKQNAGKLAGVGPDAEVVYNKHGAGQSSTPYRADLFPGDAFLAVSRVLAEGSQKYGDNNWRRIALADHLNHALVHIFAFLEGDDQDEHLEHAACRLTMALSTHLRESREKSLKEANEALRVCVHSD